MSIPPLFPVLKPKLIDATWFNVDQPCDDDNEITLLEQEHQAWVKSFVCQFGGVCLYFVLFS